MRLQGLAPPPDQTQTAQTTPAGQAPWAAAQADTCLPEAQAQTTARKNQASSTWTMKATMSLLVASSTRSAAKHWKTCASNETRSLTLSAPSRMYHGECIALCCMGQSVVINGKDFIRGYHQRTHIQTQAHKCAHTHRHTQTHTQTHTHTDKRSYLLSCCLVVLLSSSCLLVVFLLSSCCLLVLLVCQLQGLSNDDHGWIACLQPAKLFLVSGTCLCQLSQPANSRTQSQKEKKMAPEAPTHTCPTAQSDAPLP